MPNKFAYNNQLRDNNEQLLTLTDHNKHDIRNPKRPAGKPEASRRDPRPEVPPQRVSPRSDARTTSAVNLSASRRSPGAANVSRTVDTKTAASAKTGVASASAKPRVPEAKPGEKLHKPIGSPEIPDYVWPSTPLTGLAALGLSPFFVKLLIVSLALHLIVITCVTFSAPVRKMLNRQQPLDVVLVNSATKEKPKDADFLAQANLDGGGNVDFESKASTPLPKLPEQSTQQKLEAVRKENKALDERVSKVMTAPSERAPTLVQLIERSRKTPNDKRPNTVVRLNQTIEMFMLEAQIKKEMEQYQTRPKKKFVGSRAVEYRFARYVEDWRQKVEDIGNQHYPEAARRNRIYGSLQMTVAINKDGTVHETLIEQSSGNKILDAAAQKIVDMGAPYDPFPPEVLKDTDILYITRTWTFSPEGLETHRVHTEDRGQITEDR